MPKQNPWALKVYAPKTETKTFTDPLHPGAEFTLTVRPLDGCELMLALEKAEQMSAQWIGGENVYPNPTGGDSPKLSERLLQGVCLLEAQQLRPDGSPYDAENFYSADDLIGVAKNASNAWGQMGFWSQKHLNAADNPAGNASGVVGESSSALS